MIAVTLKDASSRASIIGPPMFPEPDKEIRVYSIREPAAMPGRGTYSYYGDVLDCWSRHSD